MVVMVAYGSRVLGVLALALPLGCDGKTDAAEQRAAGAGGTSAGRGGSSSGGGGSGATGGGSGGSSGFASGGRAGSGATGGTGTAGGGGRAGSTSAGGTGGGAAGAGDSDAGDAGAPNDDTITWNSGGFITAGSNTFGIQGSWFFETDCADTAAAALPCTVPDATLLGPDMRAGWTTNTTRVCTKGVAPQVINDPMTGDPAWLLQWGARLGFELNAAGSGARQPFDAEEQGITGFAFDIITQSTPPSPADLRINVVTRGTADFHFVTAILPAANMNVRFDDALQGSWATMPVRLDRTDITAITFQVYTSAAAPKPFDFCISNVRALR